jgi:membrane protein implicated in regulation of membrane protease activity
MKAVGLGRRLSVFRAVRAALMQTSPSVYALRPSMQRGGRAMVRIKELLIGKAVGSLSDCLISHGFELLIFIMPGFTAWIVSSSFWGLWGWRAIALAVSVVLTIVGVVGVYKKEKRRIPDLHRKTRDFLGTLAMQAATAKSGEQLIQIEAEARSAIFGALGEQEAELFSKQDFTSMGRYGAQSLASYLYGLSNRLESTPVVQPSKPANPQAR